jgi:hypothetical protein
MNRTMKNISKILILVINLVIWSCAQEVIDLEQPDPPDSGCISCPDGASSRTASFDKFVTLGSSFVSGFQAGALFNLGQNNSMALMIAQQLECAGGGESFNQPYIDSSNGYNVQLSVPEQGILLGRLVLFDPDGDGPESAAPAPAGAPGVPAPYNTADLPTPYAGDRSEINNFAVPLIYLGQALIPDTGNPASPYFNLFWARFSSNPGITSIVQEALLAAGDFYLIWLGVDDMLLYAAFGGDDAYPMTSVSDFNAQFNGLISAMLGANPVFKGVVGNIPEIETYPYFTTIPYNTIDLDEATASSLQSNIAENYNAFLNAMVQFQVISAEERDARILNYAEGMNSVLISDEKLTDLTQYMIDNGAQALVPFAQARQTTSTDMIPLSAGAILGELYMGNPLAVQGVSWPVADQYALTLSEIIEIKTNTAGYNSIIEGAVAASGDRLALADVNSAYNALLGASISSGGLLVDDVAIASTFAPPVGAYSEDGLHPNERGYAYTANVFIQAINSKFGATVPVLCMSNYSGTGLPVSP